MSRTKKLTAAPDKKVPAARSKKTSGTTTRKAPRHRSSPKQPLAGLQNLKVAIVCDWLTGTGGAERVVLELHRMFPAAPIYTSQYDKNPKIWYGGDWFKDADVRTTWLQRLPKKLKKFLPVLRAYTFSRLDLSSYDLVIISSGAEAKAVRGDPGTKLVWYCHAPTHYYWSRYDEYMRHPGFGLLNPLARLGLWTLVRPLRRWDHAAAQNPNFIIANSTHTASEIEKYYGRASTVVFPPADTGRFQAALPKNTPGHKPVPNKFPSPADERFGFVTAGRQTPYKRIDLAVEACSRLRLPLTVIGNGPDHNKLTAMAGPSVRFLTNVSDAEMSRHFQRAGGFIFPGIDDFGIVAVEAMSAGTPVIAFRGGGALDYVTEGATGSFFDEQTADSLAETLRRFKPDAYDNTLVARQAEQYTAARFSARMTEALQTYLGTNKEEG